MRRTRRGRLLLLTFVTLSVVAITVDFRTDLAAVDKARDLAHGLVAPLQKSVNAIASPIGDLFSSVGELSSLRSENRELKEELEALRAEVDQARTLADDNIALRAHLGLDEPWFKQRRVAAEVTAAAPGNFRWAIVIDKGRRDGIRSDMAVVTPYGLVGKVIRADPSSSLVLLLVDPELGAAAEVEGTGATGLVSGDGTGVGLTFRHVPKRVQPSPGDVVVTSSRNAGIFPPGIPIGLVAQLSGDERAAEPTIEVRPFVAPDALDVVTVLLGARR